MLVAWKEEDSDGGGQVLCGYAADIWFPSIASAEDEQTDFTKIVPNGSGVTKRCNY